MADIYKMLANMAADHYHHHGRVRHERYATEAKAASNKKAQIC